MSIFETIGAKVKDKSPEICLGIGIVGVVAGTVCACKATIKAQDIVKEAKKDLDDVRIAEECTVNPSVEYTKEDARKDKAIIFGRTVFELVKAYGPAVAFILLGIAAIVSGHHILSKRYFGLAAAYAALDESYKKSWAKVEDILGEKTARELKAGIAEHEIEVKTKKKDGKIEKKKKKIKGITPDDISPYAKFFDEGCEGWTNDPEYNLTYLRGVQNHMNDILRIKKIVTLNDVYDALGIPRTSAGQEVGWTMDGEGDGYIDFGIFKTNYAPNRDFVNGYESVILLDFNVDGPVRHKFDIINKEKRSA